MSSLSGIQEFLKPSGQQPDIFTAVDEQLGLKLQRAKAPVETIAIDQAERPSPN